MTPGPAPSPLSQQRRAPRLDVFGQLEGWLVAARQRVVVLDISTGGLGIAVRDRLEVGSVHALRLNGPTGDAVEIEARVANVRQAASPTGTPHFVVGIQLLEESEALNRMIDDLTSALSFDIGAD
jgi:hypothetical protein